MHPSPARLSTLPLLALVAACGLDAIGSRSGGTQAPDPDDAGGIVGSDAGPTPRPDAASADAGEVTLVAWTDETASTPLPAGTWSHVVADAATPGRLLLWGEGSTPTGLPLGFEWRQGAVTGSVTWTSAGAPRVRGGGFTKSGAAYLGFQVQGAAPPFGFYLAFQAGGAWPQVSLDDVSGKSGAERLVVSSLGPPDRVCAVDAKGAVWEISISGATISSRWMRGPNNLFDEVRWVAAHPVEREGLIVGGASGVRGCAAIQSQVTCGAASNMGLPADHALEDGWVHPADPRRIYVMLRGPSNVRSLYTSTGGSPFTAVPTPGSPGTSISAVALMPQAVDGLVVVTSEASLTRRFYASTDAGASWTAFNAPPSASETTAIVVDGANHLYAVTGSELFSRDM